MKEKIAVFGATSGIGLQTAADLAEMGYRVYGTVRDSQKFGQVKKHYPKIEFHSVDSANLKSLQTFFSKVGPLDHLVNVLGGVRRENAVREISPEYIIESFTLKIFNHIRPFQHDFPFSSVNGSVTLVSAVSPLRAQATEGIILPRTAEFVAPSLNAGSPVVEELPWWKWLPEDQKKMVFEQYAKDRLVGRAGSLKVISQAICFLILNSFTTSAVRVYEDGMRLKDIG
jgi:hypothetical protein